VEAFPSGGEAVQVRVFDGVALDVGCADGRPGFGAVAGGDAHLVRAHERLVFWEKPFRNTIACGQQTRSACEKKDLVQKELPELELELRNWERRTP